MCWTSDYRLSDNFVINWAFVYLITSKSLHNSNKSSECSMLIGASINLFVLIMLTPPIHIIYVCALISGYVLCYKTS